MARDTSSSSKPGKTKQEVTLKTDYCRLRKNSTAKSSGTSQTSSHSALESSKNTSLGLTSHDLQSRASPDSSVTSWSSHDHPAPQGLWDPSNPDYVQSNALNDDTTYTHQSTGQYLLHIGAQFYDVVDRGTHGVAGQWEWNADPRLQSQPHSMVSDLAPMNRYRQETLNDGPYVYMSHDGGVYGGEVAAADETLFCGSQTT